MQESINHVAHAINAYINQAHLYQNMVRYSIILAAFSSAVFFYLVLLRFFHDINEKKKALRTKRLKDIVFAYLRHPLANPKDVLIKSAKDYYLLANIAESFLYKIKGDVYDDFIKFLEKIGLYRWCIERMNKKNAEHQQIAINILSHWNTSDEVYAALCKALRSSNHDVSFAAMKAVTHFNKPDAFNHVYKALMKDDKISYLLVSHVFKLFGKSCMKNLIKIIASKNTKDDLKIASMIALEEFADSQVLLQVGLHYYNHSNKVFRTKAYHMLSLAKQEIDIDVLKFGVQDQYVHVRQMVADCAFYSMPKSTEVLYALLQDKNWLVSLKAVQNILDSGPVGKAILEKVSQLPSVAGERAKMFLSENRV